MVEEIEKMIDVAVFMKQGRLELVSDVEKLRAEENISLADKYRQLYSKEA
jgi:ABC-2 type transport system ATP-binding protein